MNTKIISIGVATPPWELGQGEVFAELQYPGHFWRLFRDAQIETRHFAVPIKRAKGLSFQEQQEEYLVHAKSLAERAFANATDGLDTGKIGVLTFATCTGFAPGPTIPDYIAQDFKLADDIELSNFSSQGCEGAFPGLRRCTDYVALHKRPAVAIACELASCAYYPEEPGHPESENSYELMRANAIFADGCSCAVIGYDGDPRHPEILDSVSVVDTKYIDYLGYTWRNGRLRVRLHRDVPKIAVELLRKSVSRLLVKRGISIRDIRYWVIHPPGAIVLDMFRDEMGLPETALKYSRKALRTVGNCSSATVGIVGKLLMEEERNPEGLLIMANVGPGMVSNAVLCRFGE